MNVSLQSRRERQSHISRLDPEDLHSLFALRDALVMDPDAEVRALAALRLDGRASRQLLPYIRDATRDRSSRVREAAFVALRRAGDAASLPRALYACQHDRAFRVRRMALLFAARACGRQAEPVVAMCGSDPFWRVRMVVKRIADRSHSSVSLISRQLTHTQATIPDLHDPDPAVVTARLLRVRDSHSPCDLVPALGHSHQPLRRLAVVEVGRRGDMVALRMATDWLRDDRVPYGPAAAEAALRRSGRRAAELAMVMLSERRDHHPGPLAWAIGATPAVPSWRQLESWLTHEDVRVRRASILRVPEAAPDRVSLYSWLARMLTDEDDETQIRVATWLAQTKAREARDLLLGNDMHALPSTARLLVVIHLINRSHVQALREFSDDEHGAIRAEALSGLSALGALTHAQRIELVEDPDPWVRRAVLSPKCASSALRDPSVEVRRAAVKYLVGHPAVEWAIAVTPSHEIDALLRAHAVNVLAKVDCADATKTLLRLFRDPDLGVRSAACAALESRGETTRGLLENGGLDSEERIAAYTLLRLRTGDSGTRGETNPTAVAHLALLTNVLEGRVPAEVSSSDTALPLPQQRSAGGRSLGTTGIYVNPFGLSGAHDLVFNDFALAHERGVNLFFWEPPHRELSLFLRRSRPRNAVVVAGTYHADANSIERDVIRALRTLNRERIDVFLAFWTRSPARIDCVGDVLRALRDRGLVRAVGISTQARDLACEAADRGFDVVMVRHSAAHRGAETTVFPHCLARGTGVLTFSNVCYGRMLHATPAALAPPVKAPECYRYSIAQRGVHACIAAPRRHAELLEDLGVVDMPRMDSVRQAELRAHGDHVYQRSTDFRDEVWGIGKPLPRLSLADDELRNVAEQPVAIASQL